MSDAAVVEKTPEPKPTDQAADTQSTDAAKPDKPFEKAMALTNARFALAESKMNRWLVSVESKITVEQILDGSFWANVAKSLRPGDEIIVRPDDMAWELVLHVSGQEPLFAHVIKKSYCDLAPSTPAVLVPSRYKIEHAGSHHKWRVLRDGAPLKDGFETESLARRYAANHQAAVER